jgi:two-component system sensor histidine kinase EvgS
MPLISACEELEQGCETQASSPELTRLVEAFALEMTCLQESIRANIGS